MRPPPSHLEPLSTRVGHATSGDNLYCGYAAIGELTGRDGFWSVVSLAAGGPRLDARAERLLDAMCAAGLAADPRIWPMKLVRVVASHGGTMAAYAAGLVWLEAATIGPWSAGACARFYLELAASLGDRTDDRDVVRNAVRAMLDGGRRLPGFGVPFRAEDERVGGIRAYVQRHGHDEGRFYRLVEHVDAAVRQARGTRINIVGVDAALLLDLGMTPRSVEVIVAMLAAPNVLANAVEGAEHAPAVLQRLPPATARYVGPAPRPSPRAAGTER